MNPIPKIPRGWRRLLTRAILRKGDKFWHGATLKWYPTLIAGARADGLIYIRRVKGRK